MSTDTLLQAINRCHNFDPWTDPAFIKVVHDPASAATVPDRRSTPAASSGSPSSRACVIGFVPAQIVPALVRAGIVALPSQTALAARPTAEFPDPPLLLHDSSAGRALFVHPPTLSYEERTAQMARASAALRAAGGDFAFVATGWRNELYTVYGPGPGDRLFSVERSVCSIFGFATYGVHATAYTVASDGTLQFWVPRRSASKQTWPGMLDNTVAGGLSAGERQLDAMVRECEEEAGLAADLVRPRLRSAGALSYFYLSGQGAGGLGLAQPEVQYLYDIELPADVRPHPVDGEAEDFTLLAAADVLHAIRTRQFKPNCALVYIDFFIRHGLLTPESEKDYALLLPRLHTDLGMATP